MMSGIEAYNGNFLADLSDLENRIANVNRQISSGRRVNQAADDPSAVAPMIGYGGELSHLKQVQTNLAISQTEAQAGDGALQAASSLLDQLVAIGARGASDTSTPADRASLGAQVKEIEQQLVSLANTSVGGRFIFGGDDPAVAPYSYNWSATAGVTQNTTPSNTATVRDSNGNEIVPRLTAQDIFDSPAGSIFQSAFNLGQALLTNNQAGASAAVDQVKAGVQQLGLASTSYGNVQNWLEQATSSAADKSANVTQALSAIRDTDIAADATQLLLNQTALQAALSAHASLNTKSLFSYLG